MLVGYKNIQDFTTFSKYLFSFSARRLVFMLGLVTLTASYCLHDKTQRNNNCSYRFQCHGNIRGAQIPQECQEAANEPGTVDLTLIDAVERFDDHIDQDFLSFVTTLRITGDWPQTNLSFLQYTMRLENLHLSGNQIENIDGNPFFNLGHLETLDLSHNKLTKIDKLFHFEYQSNKLRKLSLAFNGIEDIPGDAFGELTFLTELDLTNNRITDLTVEPFSNLTNLEILRLDNNNIKNLNGAVNNLQNLKHLYLRGNKIENIDVESLKIIIHLETFDVSWNQLEQIKPIMFSRHWKHLSGHSICKIILSDNLITSVPNAPSREITTRYVRHLGSRGGAAAVNVFTELDLSKNQISNIEYNAFQSLVKLTSLDLSKNKIIDFVVNADDIAYVTYLNLSGNYISTLYFESFKHMNSLQNLDLSYNRFEYIPDQTFHNNYKLKHVNMTFNAIQKLDNLHIDKFHPDGGILDLSNNGLTQLRIPVGEGRRLTMLSLHSNNITDPSLVDLVYQTDLKTLDMSRNRISELDENSLRLPVVLSSLDLSCNRIQKIGPSSFLRIGHLKYLRLAHNQLQSIEYGAFRGLSSLLNLDLSFNSLVMVDSKMFMDLKSLATLFLRHNGMNVIRDESWYGHKFNLKVYLDGNNLTCEWLGAALKNFNYGYSKMRPTVLEGTLSGHSLDGIPCIPGEGELASLQIQPSGLTDERLLLTSQKILEAVREQTYYLKKYIWRSLQEDTEKAKAFV